MKKPHSTISLILISILVLYCNSIVIAQTTESDSSLTAAEVAELRPIIESRIALYSKYLLEGDSVSIAAMYAKDGMMGCSSGEKIISKVGEWIRVVLKTTPGMLLLKQ